VDSTHKGPPCFFHFTARPKNVLIIQNNPPFTYKNMGLNNLTPSSTWSDDPGATFVTFSRYTSYTEPTSTVAYRPMVCTWELCGLDYSYFAYRPSKSVNTAFAALFGISALLFLAQGIASKKRWLGFTIAMVSGCALEIVGYVGRVLAYNDMYTDVSSNCGICTSNVIWRRGKLTLK
jgi:hypothetical protein